MHHVVLPAPAVGSPVSPLVYAQVSMYLVVPPEAHVPILVRPHIQAHSLLLGVRIHADILTAILPLLPPPTLLLVILPLPLVIGLTPCSTIHTKSIGFVIAPVT